MIYVTFSVGILFYYVKQNYAHTYNNAKPIKAYFCLCFIV